MATEEKTVVETCDEMIASKKTKVDTMIAYYGTLETNKNTAVKTVTDNCDTIETSKNEVIKTYIAQYEQMIKDKDVKVADLIAIIDKIIEIIKNWSVPNYVYSFDSESA